MQCNWTTVLLLTVASEHVDVEHFPCAENNPGLFVETHKFVTDVNVDFDGWYKQKVDIYGHHHIGKQTLRSRRIKGRATHFGFFHNRPLLLK